MRTLLIGLLLQVTAQVSGFAWAPAVAALLWAVLARPKAAFTEGFVVGLLAPALMLGVAAVRGAPLGHFATMMGGVFQLPGWGVLTLSCMLPALMSGGVAGAVAPLVRRNAAPSAAASAARG